VKLVGYEWIGRKAGAVRLPIERAMQIVVADQGKRTQAAGVAQGAAVKVEVKPEGKPELKPGVKAGVKPAPTAPDGKKPAGQKSGRGG
jgi:hypothetical protein